MKVYWAPVFQDTNNVDWNMLYYDIESLYDHLRENMAVPLGNDSFSKKDNFFYCPAFQNIAKNTFVLVNPLKTNVVVDSNYQVIPQEENYVGCNVMHRPSMRNRILLNYGLKWVFFCEKDLNMSLIGPYNSRTGYTNYGVLVPGQLNIGSWFRAVNCEFNLWENNSKFIVGKDEHLAYIQFDTDEKVELVRFQMNDKLMSYCSATATSNGWESLIPLVERYKRFKRSRMHRLVINEIEKNLVK